MSDKIDATRPWAGRNELLASVQETIGIIPAGDGDSVEEYHRHLIEKYDSAE